jgi:hypothetical protein
MRAVPCLAAAVLGLVFLRHLRTTHPPLLASPSAAPLVASPPETVAERPDGSLEALTREQRP